MLGRGSGLVFLLEKESKMGFGAINRKIGECRLTVDREIEQYGRLAIVL